MSYQRRALRSVVLPGFLALVCALAGVAQAGADGEAGLVIDYGGGNIATYCIGFTGDSIDGATLLQRAGVAPTESGAFVCAIGGTGCPASNCLCECSSGGACTYWSFFTQEYGSSWVYSSVGHTVARSGDGDLQAWRWGAGGPSSAPAPAAITFEQICGHAPRGGVAPPTAAPPPPTSLPPTAPPATTAPRTAATATEPGGFTPAPAGDMTVSPSVITEATRSSSPSPVVIGVGTTAPTTTRVADGEDDEDGGGDAGGLIAFGAIAGVLVVAIGGVVAWRSLRGGGGA